MRGPRGEKLQGLKANNLRGAASGLPFLRQGEQAGPPELPPELSSLEGMEKMPA
jgi:hypothetical protein